MKKITIISILSLLILSQAALVSAANDKPNENANERAFKASENKSENAIKEKLENTPVPTSIVVSPTPFQDVVDDCADGVKNHGQYVSCIAKTHQGGDVTSEAARSNIGKKVKISPTPSVQPSISPTISPIISPTISPEPSLSPTISPEVSPTATPSVSPEPIQQVNEQIEGILDQIKGLIDQIKNLL